MHHLKGGGGAIFGPFVLSACHFFSREHGIAPFRLIAYKLLKDLSSFNFMHFAPLTLILFQLYYFLYLSVYQLSCEFDFQTMSHTFLIHFDKYRIEGDCRKDAVYLSPHKFVGGVGTPGRLDSSMKSRLSRMIRPLHHSRLQTLNQDQDFNDLFFVILLVDQCVVFL